MLLFLEKYSQNKILPLLRRNCITLATTLVPCTCIVFCTLFCAGLCYSRTRLRSIKAATNGSSYCALKCAISGGKISMDCFWATSKYNFNGILAQRTDRKDQDQREIAYGDTCREKTIRRSWPWAKRDSNGESFSVIEHRGLDRKRITCAEQLSRVHYSRACGFLSRFRTTAKSFF